MKDYLDWLTKKGIIVPETDSGKTIPVKYTNHLDYLNRLTETSKLDGIKSWSLEALKTCPGSRINKKLVPGCSGCYATVGNYRFINVKKVRRNNKLVWRSPGWVSYMVSHMDNMHYFRWFDSGDCYSKRLLKKIYQIMKLTPWVKHWFPTKMYKFGPMREILDRMNQLKNVVVRFSSDDIDGTYIPGLHGSVIIPDKFFPTNAFICRAYKNNGTCNGCRACWNKKIKVIAYVAHGKKILKVLKTLNLI
jgi:hypothetical protein